MKVSWRNAGDELGKFTHEHVFVTGQLHQGKAPLEFILWLIKFTSAVNVAVNDKQIWKSTDFNNVEKTVMDALMGEPRQARVLVSIDYNIQGDWIDNECRACGYMYGTHAHDCAHMDAITKGWLEIAQSA